MPKGVSGIRAAFADAAGQAARAADAWDPPPHEARAVKVGKREETVLAGQWPGAPRAQLPPGCPVTPLGVDGKTSYFVDGLGQLIPVATSEWGKKILLQLFLTTPNYVEWAWPRWSRGKPPQINGVEVDEACACLLKAAGARGLFQPIDRVRGRGAWEDDHGRLIWHSGDRLWTVDGGKLKSSAPGELDGLFYSTRPMTIEPWPEPVPAQGSPARDIFAALNTWSWGRDLDPVIVLGGLGCLLIGGALPWRPHLFVSGDKGVGKTELQKLFKTVLGGALHDAANTTEAGVRQRLGLDTLPVAVDEMEASADNRRVEAIIELARLSSSGARLFRGGADHKGVEFQARSAFFMTGIIPPPMKPQDRSRFAMLDLGRLDEVGMPPAIEPVAGRMILRALMDQWHDFVRAHADWRASLATAGLDGRAQDTYGTLFAVAELMLGPEALEDAGVPVTEAGRLGEMVRDATAGERAEQTENWRASLEHLLGSTVDAWKGGEKPTVGGMIGQWEEGLCDLAVARDRLAAAGLGLKEEPIKGGQEARSAERATGTKQEARSAAGATGTKNYGRRRGLLAVPRSSPALARLFQGSRWQDGGWWHALKQGAPAGVVRPPSAHKINRVATYCLFVDLAAYDELTGDAGQ